MASLVAGAAGVAGPAAGSAGGAVGAQAEVVSVEAVGAEVLSAEAIEEDAVAGLSLVRALEATAALLAEPTNARSCVHAPATSAADPATEQAEASSE